MGRKILLREDNPHILKINKEALLMEDYEVVCAETIKEAEDALEKNEFDLAIFDIMLPDGDGVDFCRKVKREHAFPIIFLSALGENQDVIAGLRSGGDDYLTKPYDLGVLLARVEARIRTSVESKRFISYGPLKIDTVLSLAFCNGQDLLLTQKEFTLLEIMLMSSGTLRTKEELYESVWGPAPGSDLNVLYATVSRLNKKLEASGSGLQVVSLHKTGYTLESI